jgi:hypothetical protein
VSSARRLIVVVLGMLVLAGCRLDVTVDVAMEPDGTGTVVVEAVADEELIQRVPGLLDDLRLDDAVANGWLVDGPTLREGGGASIVLTRSFASAAELANVLTSIGPPLTRMAAARTVGEDGQVVNGINGVLTLSDGYASFADAELSAAVGGTPFGDEIAASGRSIEETFSFTYRVALPGSLESAETGTDVGDGVVQWVAPLDGSEVGLYITTVQRPAGGGWAGPIATIASVALVVWSIASSVFIAFVAIARHNKRRRRQQRVRTLGQRR